MHLNE
jgi:hypothetical protein